MRKVALITGGTRGIGLGIAESLAGSGFDLALNGVRTFNQVREVIEKLGAMGGRVIYCRGNIADADDRKQIIQEVNKIYGRLNVLINNAGIAPRERNDILETTELSYDEVMDTNLRGPYFLTQSVAKWMIEQKGDNTDYSACIINVSSISASVASVNRGEYCISKAGLAMMTQLFAARMGEFNIPVYEIRPGIIKTDMTKGVEEKYDRLILKEGLCVQKRWGKPADVGRAVTALAGGGLAYSTGQVIMVDGGLTIQRL